MGKLLKMGEAAQYINVSQDCLRKWDRANKLKPLVGIDVTAQMLLMSFLA